MKTEDILSQRRGQCNMKQDKRKNRFADAKRQHERVGHMPTSLFLSDAVAPAGLGSAAEFDLAQFAKPCAIELPEIAWRPMPCDDFLSVFRFHLHLLYLRRLRNEA